MLEGSGTQSCQFCDIYKKAGKLVFVDNTEAVYDGIIWLFCYNNWYTFLLTSGTRLTRTPKGHATVFVLSRCPYKGRDVRANCLCQKCNKKVWVTDFVFGITINEKLKKKQNFFARENGRVIYRKKNRGHT